MTDGADPNEIARLATAANPIEAHVWEQALRDEGIECRVVGDYLDAGIGDISGLQPEVWVHHKDLAQAEAVLERYRQAAAEAGPQEPEAQE